MSTKTRKKFKILQTAHFILQRIFEFRFNDSDFENGYSRNLLWRLWHASRALEMEYLHEKCTEVSVTVIVSNEKRYRKKVV